MTILLSFAACSNNSASSGDGTSVGGQGNSEAYRLSDDYFEVKDCEDGIFFECVVPGGTNRTQVYIDGIGKIADDIMYNENKTKGHFFYPFLDSGKKYTILVKFKRDEDFDEDGYCLGHVYTSDTAGWFETEVTAGAKSKGEVSIEDFGEIEVEKNGDFTFTKKIKFKNEQLLTGDGYDWLLEIGLNKGKSWLHPDRRSIWMTQIQIPNNELLGKTYNFYTYPRPYGDVTKVDFIVWRPIMYYEYKEKEYRYEWDGYTLDTDCTAEDDLWTDIDITKSADVAKIQGTWTYVWEGKYDWNDISCYNVDTETLIIEGDTVKTLYHQTHRKLDGTAFTFTEDELKDRDYELSSDGKTITDEWEDEPEELSEYFEDDEGYVRGNDDTLRRVTNHYELKFFYNGTALRIITSRKYEDGELSEWYTDFQKQ